VVSYAHPSSSQPKKVLIEKFFLFKIRCFDQHFFFDPPNTHQEGRVVCHKVIKNHQVPAPNTDGRAEKNLSDGLFFYYIDKKDSLLPCS